MTIAALLVLALQETEFDPSRLVRQVLVTGCHDPLQLEVARSGEVYYVERAGRVRRYDPRTQDTVTLGTVPVSVHGEVGLLGIALDPDFPRNRLLYLFFCPAGRKDTLRLSRFRCADAQLDLTSERELLSFPISPIAQHMGGGLGFGPDRNLYIGTGDDSPWKREPETDQRPGRENWDALRTSGNTADLRGKILRIRPDANGSYGIPPGNLFPPGTEGTRPEIFVMGCRNAFRFSFDPKTGCLYWGDVGPNTLDKYGSEGYDEINRSPNAGNYGWPLFSGPNEAYRRFDFATGAIGAPYDPARPVNESRNNTGLPVLPEARPALLWYPSGDSKEFPELGSGARSAMSGPVYRFDPALDSPDKLPPAYDGSLFVYDWGRNWIKSVRLTADGAVDRIEPFMPHTSFRKPVDLKTGPDGALYVIEFGDKWNGNTDGTIVRLAYVRGNRAPTAVASAEPRAGRHPLPVRFSGVGSIDPDTQDVLTYRWSIEGRTAEGVEADHTFEKPGIYTAWLEVSDPRGARSRSAVEVRVGNAPPRVTILEPVHGGFVDGGRKLRFRAVAEDDEDGSTADGRILAGLVEVHAGFRVRNDRAVHPGLALIRSTTCWSCHKPQEKAVGPSYREVAAKYAGQAAARNLLATKVLEGGKGAWGEVPMIPHPQHTMEQSRSMVDWILTLAENPSEQRLLGTEFELDTPEKPPAGGVFEVSASYTDRGTEVAGKSTAQAKAVLHFRRKPAEFADGSHKAPVVEVFEGGRRLAAQFAPEGHLLFREINLRGIARIRLEAAAPAGRGGRLELRADSPEGRLLGTVEVPSTGAWHAWKPLSMNVDDPGGVRDLYLVASSRDLRSEPLLNLAWIEFLER